MKEDKVGYNFTLKHVNKTSDEDYIKALKIYNDTTPYEIRTNTNEITFWLNKCKQDDEPFVVYAFILYLNGEVIGLSMTTYLKSTKVVIDEYLAVYEQFRVNTVFLIYFSLIQNYYSEKNIDVSYYITEISNKGEGKAINCESRISIRILCLEDFGKIDAPYYVLPLGLENHESSFEAFLYIKTNDNISEINNITYLNTVKSIYYDYFYNWYKPLMCNDSLKLYKEQIDTIYKKIQNTIFAKDKSEVRILMNSCSVLENYKDTTAGAIPQIKSKGIKFPFEIILLILLPLFIIIIYVYTLDYLKIPLNGNNTALGAICSAIITSISTILISKKQGTKN